MPFWIDLEIAHPVNDIMSNIPSVRHYYLKTETTELSNLFEKEFVPQYELTCYACFSQM